MSGALVTSPHIPIEIHEQVIDHLWDAKMTLKACALVHRTWSARSQAALFSEVLLDTEERWERLIDVLKSAESRLASYIRTVIIGAGRPRGLPDNILTPSFSCARKLHFVNVIVDVALIYSARSLDTLILFWCHIPPVDIACFPSQPRASLRCLDLVQEPLSLSFSSINGFLITEKLEDLSVSLLDKEGFEDAVLFINSHLHITALSLRFSIWMEYKAVQEYLGILKLPSLRVLNIECGGNEDVLPILFDILHSTEPPQLARIGIRFASLGMPEPFEPLASPSMQGRDWLIPSALASQLESVEIVYDSIHEVANEGAFYELFGTANRPSVVRVHHENIS